MTSCLNSMSKQRTILPTQCIKGHLSDIGYDQSLHDAEIDLLRHLTDISAIIRGVVKIYEKLYQQSAYYINCGNCEEFACDVIDIMGGETDDLVGVWHDNMPDCTKREKVELAHHFIMYHGRFYDSEHPEGVDNWRDIPANCL